MVLVQQQKMGLGFRVKVGFRQLEKLKNKKLPKLLFPSCIPTRITNILCVSVRARARTHTHTHTHAHHPHTPQTGRQTVSHTHTHTQAQGINTDGMNFGGMGDFDPEQLAKLMKDVPV